MVFQMFCDVVMPVFFHHAGAKSSEHRKLLYQRSKATGGDANQCRCERNAPFMRCNTVQTETWEHWAVMAATTCAPYFLQLLSIATIEQGAARCECCTRRYPFCPLCVSALRIALGNIFRVKLPTLHRDHIPQRFFVRSKMGGDCSWRRVPPQSAGVGMQWFSS